MKELVVKLKVDGSGVFPAFATLEKRANSLASGAFGNLKAAIGGAFAVGAIVAAGKRTMEWAGHLTDVATRLGVSTEWVQEMTYALKQSGASMEDLVSFTEKLNKARATALMGGDKGADIAASFQSNFGVGADMLKGPVQPIIDAIAKSFESGNVQQLNVALQQMGIKGAGSMTAAFADGLADGRKQIRDAGGVASEDIIEQLDAAGDAIQTLSTILQAQLAPALVEVVRAAVQIIGSIRSSASFLGGGTAKFSTSDWLREAAALPFRSAADMLGKSKGADTTSDKWAQNRDNALSATSGLGMIGSSRIARWLFQPSKFDSVAASSASKGEEDKLDAMMKSFDTKNSNRINRRKSSGLGEFDFEPDAAKQSKAKRARADSSDSLVSVGNFLGSGGSAMEKIGNETNRLLREIALGMKNFKPSTKEYKDDLGLA